MRKTEKVILALDVDSPAKAGKFIKKLHAAIGIFKVGSVLFTAAGPQVIGRVHRAGCRVFLDLKFHDIPNTVAGAVRQAARLGVFMLTVHTCGGKEMLEAAAAAARDQAKQGRTSRPLVVGVTVLTSDKGGADTAAEVVKRARLARECGLDGVVCSVQEAAAVRKACGKNFIIVTPGIRPAGTGVQDQKRVATPQTALAAGADYLVVGRPILEAKNPLQAVNELF
jgi:orotidine-5'-phosphate decarboxylase